MTERSDPDPAIPESEAPGYSKDYWDIVFEQLARRRLFKSGLAVLAVLYGLAIYAPMIGNDRPYVLEAIDYKAYDRARKSLYPVTLSLNGRIRQTAEEYLAERIEGSDQTYEGAVEAERGALRQRIETMMGYLPPEAVAPLEAFLVEVDRAADARLAGDAETAATAADGLEDLAKAIRGEFEPRRPDRESGDGDENSAGVELVGRVSYPLLEATTPYEVFFMVLWAFVLLWPLWNRIVNRVALAGDRARIRKWRKRKLLVVLSISLVAAGLWQVTIGGVMTFESAPFKDQLTSEQTVAARVVFPPLAFGFAETHLAETYRPPTWKSNADISEEGYYVRGPRVPQPEPVTGQLLDPSPVDVRFAEPGRNSPLRHLLGTDQLGRDMLVRSLWGARVSLAVGLVAAFFQLVIGVTLGCLAGYFGGWVDMLISRVIEIVLCFPVFFMILVVVAFVGPSILNIMVVIGLLRWTGIARLVRGEILRLKEQEFVIAARAQGLSPFRIVFRHLLPNAMGPVLVAGAFAVAAGILIESALSFLGFGIQLPIPSWGALLTESRNAEHWWIHLFPGLLIFVTVLCYNLVGDGIRDAMDPKLKE